MRTTSLPSFLLTLLLAGSAAGLAQEKVRTRDLAGRFELTVTGRQGPELPLPGAVSIDVTSHGRMRIDLDGRRARLVRKGYELSGKLPRSGGIAGGLGGEAPAEPLLLRLTIRGKDELAGELSGSGVRVELRLRREGSAGREALLARASKFVVDNAQTEADEERMFPPLDSGNAGVHAYLVEGAGAQRLLSFTRAWHGDDAEVQAQAARFDPAREVLLTVLGSDDDEVMWVVILDRASGAGRLLGSDMCVVDLSGYFEQDALEAILPGVPPIEDMGMCELMEGLGWRHEGPSSWTELELPRE